MSRAPCGVLGGSASVVEEVPPGDKFTMVYLPSLKLTLWYVDFLGVSIPIVRMYQVG